MTSTADRMYPTTAEASNAPAAPALPPAEQSIADRLYGPKPLPPKRTDIPPAIRAERQNDPARQFFDDEKAFVSELPDDSIPGIDAREARKVALDIGAEPPDVAAYRHLAAKHAAEPVTKELHETWVAESRQMLSERGFTDADMALARRFVARDHRLHDALADGLGSHPQVVQRVIELAQRARAAGKLK